MAGVEFFRNAVLAERSPRREFTRHNARGKHARDAFARSFSHTNLSIL
jgi:hypothetical protein